jgi:hypothetical protein
LRCQRTTVSGWTMTRASRHPDQIRDRKTQKVRSSEVIRGLGPFRAKVASCWRRASSTTAWLFRFRKKAGTQRRRSITNLSSGHIARCILHGITGHCETDSSSGSGLPWVVDRLRAATEYSMIPRRTDCENPQEGNAASRLGINPNTLRSRMKRLGITRS